MRVGLLGAGLMGRGMGHRLLQAGHALNVMAHRRRDAVDELVRLGGVEHATPRALADASEVVITCLPDAPTVEQVLFGAGGVAQVGHALLVIDCSTSLPEASRSCAERLRVAGHDFVDAPITGGPAQAMQGQLVGLLGGEPGPLERAQAVLQSFCASTQVFGGVGCGHAAKLINNGIAFGVLSIVSEAIATALKQGLDMRALLGAIERSGGQTRVLQGLAPWLLEGNTQFLQVTVDTAGKDVDYYLQFARTVGTSGPVFETVHAQYQQAIAAGAGDQLLPAYPAAVAARAGVKTPPTR